MHLRRVILSSSNITKAERFRFALPAPCRWGVKRQVDSAGNTAQAVGEKTSRFLVFMRAHSRVELDRDYNTLGMKRSGSTRRQFSLKGKDIEASRGTT